jgi:hypothetical protein
MKWGKRIGAGVRPILAEARNDIPLRARPAAREAGWRRRRLPNLGGETAAFAPSLPHSLPQRNPSRPKYALGQPPRPERLGILRPLEVDRVAAEPVREALDRAGAMLDYPRRALGA